ncbi:MAG: LysR family transcriptional regulator [Lachnospiraceae bacterium]|nr:LysR family transcriptional regulator [Lachnospiraceae bacterium]
MNTKQLTTFVTLTDTGNYIKASDRLSYAPSTLAKHIRSLESELGVRLVEYRGNKIFLTEEGQRFHGYAMKILETYWAATEEFSASGSLQGSIRVAGGEPIAGFSLSRLFLDFSAQYPNVYTSVQIINCARIPAWIREREVDMGYTYEMEILDNDHFSSIPLFNEPICLMTTKDNPLASYDKVYYQDLKGQKFAFTYDDCCFTMVFRNRMRREGALPSSELFLGSESAIMNSVYQDHRIALMPLASVPLVQDDRLICLPWADEPLRSWVQILYDRGRRLSPIEKELIRQTKDYVEDMVRKSDGQLCFP